MDPVLGGALLLVCLLLLLAAGVWVGVALLVCGYIGVTLLSPAPAGSVMATTLWGSSASWALTALPMFVWMGEILYRARLAEDLFEGLRHWLNRLPGGLVHLNIYGSGVFAAVSGSSPATIGRMPIPALKARGYPNAMAVGTLAGSGTLGLLIPPSIILIIYGVAAETSIPQLFIAGVIPGLLLMTFFSGYVIFHALTQPERYPQAERGVSFGRKLHASRRLIPTLALIVVIGSIYAGVATPTEAAVIGVAGALLFAALSGSMTLKDFWAATISAMKTTCMITIIAGGAHFLTVAMTFSGLPQRLAEIIAASDLSALGLIGFLTVLFIVLGFFLEGISIVLIAASVLLPMVKAAGIDLIWFGIYLALVVEMGMITPPVGLNLFVLKALTGQDIFRISMAALPFFFLMLAMIGLLTVFPELALFLPERMLAD